MTDLDQIEENVQWIGQQTDKPLTQEQLQELSARLAFEKRQLQKWKEENQAL